jgi:hypothetical protein
MNTNRNQERIQEIQQITGLKPTHFSDLIRVAQLIYDPAGGVSGRMVKVSWLDFGIPPGVADNLRSLGEKYQYESPMWILIWYGMPSPPKPVAGLSPTKAASGSSKSPSLPWTKINATDNPKIRY